MYYQLTQEAEEKLKKIKIVAFDVDGVLTDGGMYYSHDGDVMKKFSARDGMGITKLREAGYKVVFITGEENEMVKKRAAKLKIDDLRMFARNKVEVAESVLAGFGYTFEEMLFVGDDWLDVELLSRVGFACTPADGLPWAKQKAYYVCEHKGGSGVAAEVYGLIASIKK